MFDIGFSELFLTAIVALVVLGPERLPKAARFAGLWVRRARAQWYSVKSELERELASEELQRTVRDTRQTVADIGADMRAAEAEARREYDAMHAQIERGAAPALDNNTALIDSEDTRLLGDSSLDDVAGDGVIHDKNNDEGSDVRR